MQDKILWIAICVNESLFSLFRRWHYFIYIFFFQRWKPIKYIVHLDINFAIEINAKVRMKKKVPMVKLWQQFYVQRYEIENSSGTPKIRLAKHKTRIILQRTLHNSHIKYFFGVLKKNSFAKVIIQIVPNLWWLFVVHCCTIFQ